MSGAAAVDYLRFVGVVSDEEGMVTYLIEWSPSSDFERPRRGFITLDVAAMAGLERSDRKAVGGAAAALVGRVFMRVRGDDGGVVSRPYPWGRRFVLA